MYKILALIPLIIISCKQKEKSAEFYYAKGLELAKKGKYQSCIFNLDKVDEIAPYSQESKNASPILIFCHYAIKDFESMHSEIDSFEAIHPTSSELPYLYYLKTLSYYKIFKNYRKGLQVVDSLKNGIDKVSEIDNSAEYSRNLNVLLPFVAQVRDKHSIYIANQYAVSGNFIASASRYSTIHTTTESEDTKKIVENSMQTVLDNLGIKE